MFVKWIVSTKILTLGNILFSVTDSTSTIQTTNTTTFKSSTTPNTTTNTTTTPTTTAMPGKCDSSHVSSLSLIYIYIYNICIYINHIIVDCVWSDWVEGDCSTTCGAGQQNNTRAKLIEETNGGNCTGESTEVLSCVFRPCPGTYQIKILT